MNRKREGNGEVRPAPMTRWQWSPISWPSARHQPKRQDHGQCVTFYAYSSSSLRWYRILLGYIGARMWMASRWLQSNACGWEFNPVLPQCSVSQPFLARYPKSPPTLGCYPIPQSRTNNIFTECPFIRLHSQLKGNKWQKL